MKQGSARGHEVWITKSSQGVALTIVPLSLYLLQSPRQGGHLTVRALYSFFLLEKFFLRLDLKLPFFFLSPSMRFLEKLSLPGPIVSVV